MLTDRTCGIDSVMRRRPLSRTSRVTMRVREPLTTCVERDYRSRLLQRCYHAPPPSCNRCATEKEAGKARLDAGRTIKDPDPDHHVHRRPPRFGRDGARRARAGARFDGTPAIPRAPALPVD